jgi:hypothetical protein
MRAPGFVDGVVVGRDGAVLELRDRTTGELVTVEVAERGSLWRGERATVEEIELGDRVAASGEQRGERSIMAEIVSVNAGQVRGPITGVLEDGSWLVEERAGSAAVYPTGRTVRVLFDPGRPPRDGDGRLIDIEDVPRDVVGKGAWVYGFELPDGSLRATTVMSPR